MWIIIIVFFSLIGIVVTIDNFFSYIMKEKKKLRWK